MRWNFEDEYMSCNHLTVEFLDVRCTGDSLADVYKQKARDELTESRDEPEFMQI